MKYPFYSLSGDLIIHLHAGLKKKSIQHMLVDSLGPTEAVVKPEDLNKLDKIKSNKKSKKKPPEDDDMDDDDDLEEEVSEEEIEMSGEEEGGQEEEAAMEDDDDVGEVGYK